MTPQQRAHLRLIGTLPVKTHKMHDEPEAPKVRKKIERTWSTKPKAVVVKGKEFRSLSSAARYFRQKKGTVHYWLQSRSDCYYA